MEPQDFSSGENGVFFIYSWGMPGETRLEEGPYNNKDAAIEAAEEMARDEPERSFIVVEAAGIAAFNVNR